MSSALLTYMATVPGVVDKGSATTIGTRESGTVLAIPSTTPGFTFEAIIDSSTSQILETRSIVSDPSKLYSPSQAQVAAGQAIAPLQTGEAKDWVDFIYAGIASSADTVPTSAPVAPPAWPFDSVKEPLPGSAY
jgi:hypothetical protein